MPNDREIQDVRVIGICQLGFPCNAGHGDVTIRQGQNEYRAGRGWQGTSLKTFRKISANLLTKVRNAFSVPALAYA